MLVFREAREFESGPTSLGNEGRYTAPAAPQRATALQVSVPTPFGWYFFTVRFGRERRSAGRLIDEGQLSLAKLSLFYTLAMWMFVGLAGLGVMVGIYFIKSMAGIDLMNGPSFLHDFIY